MSIDHRQRSSSSCAVRCGTLFCTFFLLGTAIITYVRPMLDVQAINCKRLIKTYYSSSRVSPFFFFLLDNNSTWLSCCALTGNWNSATFMERHGLSIVKWKVVLLQFTDPLEIPNLTCSWGVEEGEYHQGGLLKINRFLWKLFLSLSSLTEKFNFNLFNKLYFYFSSFLVLLFSQLDVHCFT